MALDRDIQSYYNEFPEESRLSQGPFQLEKVRTRQLIRRSILPAPATVLDVGGGAGEYALWLTELGYRVHLLEPVERLVREAQLRSGRGRQNLASAVVADARELPVRDSSSDIVLMLGPLYHLPDATERSNALGDAYRVLKSGGKLFVAAINRWASAFDGLFHGRLADPAFRAIVERDLMDGQHRNPEGVLEYFTTAYFHRPEELESEVAAAGFVVDGVYGVEGPGWLLGDFDERWSDHEGRSDIVQMAEVMESEQALLGLSAHLLTAATKL